MISLKTKMKKRISSKNKNCSENIKDFEWEACLKETDGRLDSWKQKGREADFLFNVFVKQQWR